MKATGQRRNALKTRLRGATSQNCPEEAALCTVDERLPWAVRAFSLGPKCERCVCPAGLSLSSVVPLGH